ncbi:MAG: glycosyltransferase family 2 protein [Longimicrobiales bacterium]
MPFVSVIIPTYNQADLLRDCLDSVFAQSYRDFEVIVVNNHSEDHTRDVVLSFQDDRLTLIDFANHGVIGAGRNKGVEESNGEWLAFLDSDDLWMEDKLKACVEDLEGGRNLICHRAVIFRGDRDLGLTKPVAPADLDYRSMLFGRNCLTPSTTMVERSFFEAAGGFEIDPEINTAEDFALWLKLAKIGIRARILNHPLARYRVHELSNSARIVPHIEAVLRLIEQHYDALEDKGPDDQRLFSRIQAVQYYGAGRRFQKQGERGSALMYYKKSFALYPKYPKLYPAIMQSLLGIK